MLSYKSSDLFNVGPTETLTDAKLLSGKQSVSSVVERKLAHDVVTQLYVEDMVVLSFFKHGVAWVILWLLDSAHAFTCAAASIGVDYFTHILPLILCSLPHVCRGHSVLLENLDVAFGFAAHLGLFTHIWSFCKLIKISAGCLGLELSLKFF
mgnify:CR=1 FL=1